MAEKYFKDAQFQTWHNSGILEPLKAEKQLVKNNENKIASSSGSNKHKFCS